MSRPLFGRRVGSRALRWGLSAALGTILLFLATTYGLPLVARTFVWGLRVGLDGVLWVALSISTGGDLWTIAGSAGRAVGATLMTPQAIGGTGALLAVGALAAWGLRRLFESGKESAR